MRLNEVYDSAVPGYQDTGDESSTQYAKRKTRLTLKQLNKLRRMNDIREYEKQAKLKHVRAQYGTPPEEEAF